MPVNPSIQQCEVCRTTFSFTRRRHWCRTCNRTICFNCSSFQDSSFLSLFKKRHENNECILCQQGKQTIPSGIVSRRPDSVASAGSAAATPPDHSPEKPKSVAKSSSAAHFDPTEPALKSMSTANFCDPKFSGLSPSHSISRAREVSRIGRSPNTKTPEQRTMLPSPAGNPLAPSPMMATRSTSAFQSQLSFRAGSFMPDSMFIQRSDTGFLDDRNLTMSFAQVGSLLGSLPKQFFLSRRLQSADAAGQGMKGRPSVWQAFVTRVSTPAALENIVWCVEARGRLAKDHLRASAQMIVDRHSMLRSTLRNGQLVVFPSAELDYKYILPRGDTATAISRAAEQFNEQCKEKFNLDTKMSLFRMRVLRQRAEDGTVMHRIALVFHRGIADMTSVALVVEDLRVLYQNAYDIVQVRGGSSSGGTVQVNEELMNRLLPVLTADYERFTEWEQQYLLSSVSAEHKQHWATKIAESTPVLEIPVLRARALGSQEYAADCVPLGLPPSLREELDAWESSHATGVHTLLLGAFVILLHRYTSQENVVVAVAHSTRVADEFEDVVGPMTNYTPHAFQVSPSKLTEDFVAEVKSQLTREEPFVSYPFGLLGASAAAGRYSLAQAAFIDEAFLSNAKNQMPFVLGMHGARAEFAGLEISSISNPSFCTTMFDIELHMWRNKDNLEGAFVFQTDCVDRWLAQQLAEDYVHLLQHVMQPNYTVAQIPIVTPSQRDTLLTGFNKNRLPSSIEEQAKCRGVHALAVDSVPRFRDNIALASPEEGTFLSYGELDGKSNRLAHLLCATYGATCGKAVAICMPRCAIQILCTLAVLKSGAAYLPLDPSYPVDRLEFMLNDSPVCCVLTSRVTRCGPLQVLFEGYKAAPFVDVREEFDNVTAPFAANEGSPPNVVAMGPDSWAYIIYTSGSTGKPKGVLMRHGALVNLIHWQNSYLPRRPTQQHPEALNVLQFSPISFDVSFQETYSTWSLGGCMFIVSEALRTDPLLLLKYIMEHNVHRIFLPFVALSHIAEAAEEHRLVPRCLTDVITAGEQLIISRPVKKFFGQLGSDAVLHNHYGPSETHVCSYEVLMGDASKWLHLPAIGKPISNTQLFVVDDGLSLVPVGVCGELLIAGSCLGAGYLKRPDVTEKAFVACSFEGATSERMYRTGDLVYFRPDGNLFYVRRKDSQVKIRGFRIELGEIEAALSQHESVRKCCVVVREDASHSKRLVAYVVKDPSTKIAQLKAFLRSTLPDYMVPQTFVTLDQLPLTPSGKINRRGLPEPQDDESDDVGQTFVEPRSGTEGAIAEIWKEVLGLKRISATVNFFEIGGHSLSITKVISRIRTKFDIEVPVADAFGAPTVAQMAVVVNKLGELKSRTEENPYELAAKALKSTDMFAKGTYPLTFNQQSILFLATQKPEAAALYNIPMHGVLRSGSKVTMSTIRDAFQRVLNQHASLRTTYLIAEETGQYAQRVHSHQELDFNIVNYEDDPSLSLADRSCSRVLLPEAVRPFNLEKDSLMRVAIYEFCDGRILQVVFHHIATDLWSIAIIFDDLIAAMNGQLTSPLLSRHGASYTDYALYQQQQVLASFPRSAIAWKSALHVDKIELPLLNFPIDRRRPAVQSHRGQIKLAKWPSELCEKFQRMCTSSGSTLYVALVAVLFEALHKYTRQDEIVIGTPMACRNVQRFETTVGYFVNAVAVVQSFLESAQMTFKTLLSECRESLLFALQHQEYPFPLLADNVVKHRSASHTPVFQALFTFQKPHIHEDLVPFIMHQEGYRMSLGEDAEWRSFPVHTGLTMYDLIFQFAEPRPGGDAKFGKQLCATVEYNADIFLPETIEGLLNVMQYIAEQVTENTDILLEDIRTLRPSEETPFIARSNEHKASAARPGLSQLVSFGSLNVELLDDSKAHFLHVFQHIAAAHPSSIALQFGYGPKQEVKTMSFSELWDCATAIATHLRESFGKLVETITAVCLNRGIEMIVSFVSVLLGGGPYLPLDPKYPPERLSFMVQNSNSKLVITTAKNQSLFSSVQNLHILLIEDLMKLPHSKEQVATLAPEASASNLAYIIYTSGSTGTPKGTALMHRGLVNMAYAIRHDYLLKFNRFRFLLFASASFDASVLEIFATLLNAGTVVMLSEESIVGDQLARAMSEAGVTVAVLPPAVLGTMSEDTFPPQPLEVLVTAGEAINDELLSRWKSKVRMLNAYGPTENTVASTVCDYALVPWHSVRAPPIGKSLPNCRCYVLDEKFRPVAPGVPGELVVSGPGIARGYWNLPEKTASVFLPNPFDGNAFPRMYRTGDLVRFLPCKMFEFLGRIDGQVKLRGYRIELGEVEAVVCQFEGIAECAVTLQDLSTGKALVAYIVMKSEGTKSTTSQLRGFVKKYLPDYMVPSAFVTLARLPLNPSGKVDRKALPTLFSESSDDETLEKVNARTPTEAALLVLFREVLGPDVDIGVQDSFFDLGGHSLAAMQLAARIREALAVDVPLAKIFECSSLGALAEKIDSLQSEKGEEVVLRHRGSSQLLPSNDQFEIEAPLSHNQEALWYAYISDRQSPSLNASFACHLRTPQFDIGAFEKAICGLVMVHPSLRSKFIDGSCQRTLRSCRVPFETVQWTAEEATSSVAQRDRIEHDLHGSLRIEEGEVFKVFLYRSKLQFTHFALLFHHIILDLGSIEIILSHLPVLYEGFRLKSGPLRDLGRGSLAVFSPELFLTLKEFLADHGFAESDGISFTDYVHWIREIVASARGDRQLGFWQRQLAGHPATSELVPDFARPNLPTHAGGTLIVPFPAELVQKISDAARTLSTTSATLLLSSIFSLICRLTLQTDIVIGTPVSGRTRVELENLVGDFVNVLPLRVQMGDASALSFKQLVRLTKNTLIGALVNQEYPFSRIVQKLLHHRTSSRHPIFQILFVHEKPHHSRTALSPFILGDAGGALPFGEGQVVESLSLTEHNVEFDLVFAVSEGAGGRFDCRIQYAKELYRDATIHGIADQWIAILNDSLDNPSKSIPSLMRLSPQDSHKVLNEHNKSEDEFEALQKDQCLVQLFEMSAERNAALRALADPHRSLVLTYAELNRLTNRLGRTLLKAFAKLKPTADVTPSPPIDCDRKTVALLELLSPKRVVAIFLPRSAEYVLSVVGTAKSGAAYTPIDICTPLERVSYILQDSGACAVLTQQKHCDFLRDIISKSPALSERGLSVMAVDHLCSPGATSPQFCDDDSSLAGSDRRLSAAGVVYIIYTSGSTGTPKGVMIHNTAVVNLCSWFIKSHKMRSGDVTAQCLGAGFDPVTIELWPALLVGASVAIMDEESKMGGPDLTLKFLEANGVTHITFPPVLSKLIFDRGIFPAGLKVKQWDCGGDKFAGCALPLPFALANAYGPTEACVQCSQYLTNFETPEHPLASPKAAEPQRISVNPPLGGPTANTALYVLDPLLQPVPAGTVGELCVGGAQVGVGYIGRPDATAKAFVPDPFLLHSRYALSVTLPDGSVMPPRMYRTGDLVRMDSGGHIFFIGRKDFQAKIRGFRIELGEIEAVIAQCPFVQDSCVVVHDSAEDEEKKLYAFVTLKEKEVSEASEPNDHKFRSECTAQMKTKLPHYMIPHELVVLSELPLNANGKVDRAALKALQVTRSAEEQRACSVAFQAPATHVQKTLCTMWEEILHTRPIGITDNWYEKGGSSLSSTMLLSRVRQVFQTDVTLSVFFSNPRIASMAKLLEEKGTHVPEEDITELLQRDGTGLPSSISPAAFPRYVPGSPVDNIFVTGATGFFGAFLVAELLRTTDANIYCLVRASTEAEASKRVAETLLKYGIVDDPNDGTAGISLPKDIDLAVHGARVRPVVGDLAKPNFGLSAARFAELASIIDVIIHNGALVNFGYPYVSLKAPNVDGTITSLKLATTSRLKPFHFVSTLSVLVDGNLSEIPLTNATKQLHGGYTQSKWVAERLVTMAHERGLPVTVFRAGRITGHSLSGATNVDDFLNLLIKGSLQMGCAPALQMKCDMTPVDFCARVLVHCALRVAPSSVFSASNCPWIFHLITSSSMPFVEVFSIVLRCLGTAPNLVQLVKYDVWRSEHLLKLTNESHNALLPLVPLFDADFEKMVSASVAYDTSNLRAAISSSGGVPPCPPTDERLVQVYATYFIAKGFFAKAK